jgi:hypothetical protein
MMYRIIHLAPPEKNEEVGRTKVRPVMGGLMVFEK